MQGSLLLFFSRSRLAPYVLGGYGTYQRSVESLDAEGAVVESTSVRENGAHLGLGAELFASRHVALFLDYRYRFVRFGEREDEAEPLKILFTDALKLSHRGTMWTGGVVFYF